MKMANSKSDKIVGLIGKGVQVSGDILFTEVLRIEGSVAGSLIAEGGTLILAETARVQARVEVDVCIISGVLEGNVKAKSRVELHKTSQVQGDIITPVLLMEEGAQLNGSVGMKEDSRSRFEEAIGLDDGSEKVMVKGA